MAWIERKLGDVCRLINGRAYKKHEMLSEGPYPLLRVGNFFTNRSWYYSDMELHADKYCDDGDLLYAWSASFGPRIWDGGKVIYHYHIWKIEIDKELVDKNYLYYLLDWDKELIKSEQGAGTTMVHVTKGSMEKRILPFPCVEEQKRIVATLDQFFGNIEKARATAEKNLKNARELFDSYLQQVFSQRGEGWVETTLGQMAEVSSGGTPLKSKTEFWDGAIPWYSSGELNSTFTTDSKELITETGLNNSNAKLFPKGSLLIGMYDTAALKMSILERQGAFNQAIAGVKPNENIVLEFVLHSINHIKPELLKLRRGVRQKNLNQSRIKAIPIRVPPVSEQIKIVEELKVLREKTDTLFGIYEKKLKSLEELKKSILQKAFTGELTKSKGIAA